MTDNLTDEARTLSQQHLRELPQRWHHIQEVAAASTAAARLVDPARADEIAAAAWLHDIGYADDLATTGFHPLDGARFANDAGMPELVVSLIAFHTGAEFEAEERRLISELQAFRHPPRDVLDIVTFADLTTAPDGDPIDPEDRIAEILTRYEEGSPVFAAVTRSAPTLLESVARVRERLDRATRTPTQPR